ncbi:hypothetical protein ACFY7C_12190 [Streptomyces sp. NPDC012769]|uniref:hypothetical protein n=1 Tax=Streptomyces sp. NPDC012769 TaxID=3364848 RepID=UPI0036835624
MNTHSIRSHDALMRAFAVAEMVTASLDEPPTSVSVRQCLGITSEVDVYFHQMPEHVLAAAEKYGVEPVLTPNYADDPNLVCTEAHVQCDGVAVRFWALVNVAVVEVAA